MSSPTALRGLSSTLRINGSELRSAADPLIEFDCGVGFGLPASMALPEMPEPRRNAAAALSVAAAAAAGPLSTLFLGSVEALSSLLAVFFGRDPQASFAAGNVLARVLPDTEPQAADAAMQYFWHAGSEGIVQAADAREAPRHAKSGFVAAMLARAGQPFCSAAGFRPAGEINKDPFIA